MIIVALANVPVGDDLLYVTLSGTIAVVVYALTAAHPQVLDMNRHFHPGHHATDLAQDTGATKATQPAKESDPEGLIAPDTVLI